MTGAAAPPRLGPVPLGGTGVQISEFALGTLNFGLPGRPTETDAGCRAVLDTYQEAGGTVLDTAVTYADGAGESVLGRLLRGRREQFLLGTKFGLRSTGLPFSGGLSRRSLADALERSLRRLDTDRVDLLWVHAWHDRIHPEELVRALDEQVRAGKVLYAGICNAPAWVVSRHQTLAAERDRAPFSAMQVEYSLLQRDAERELLPMARAFGLPVFAWSPLGRGRLVGAAGPGEPPRTAALAGALELAGRELGLPAAAVALAYVRAKGLIPVVGASDPAQLGASLRGAGAPLPSTVLDRLDAASAVDLGWPHDFLRAVAGRMTPQS
ncbi:aryl-alcohol dehydrogenase-like predicted oxidoreductase [Kitasatospora gansuensis]|uniref:Aryl-alcohol dehydrogenase-like predicted oxidoreductase n=1 Tax=Kitasatospora gansuensis TaxID=258050 RepID=A0A7W7SBM1_9ACTN|nr:aldo/keto reductase [Kitasatospora gansuensis]MBB4947500.1 aryl-alcohol dehydrogenase-like predicted oxidoreductase [Kitasatospora gansuensis]